MPLVSDPGTRWEYGTNTVAGAGYRAVSGQDLATVYAEGIFDPLAMGDATFTPTEEQDWTMTMHHRTPDGGLIPTPQSSPADPELHSGEAGALATGLEASDSLAIKLTTAVQRAHEAKVVLADCYFWIGRATGVAGALFKQVLPLDDERIVEPARGFEHAIYALIGAPAARKV